MDLNGNGLIKVKDSIEVVEDELESEVSFVRILWVTHSGQHRCRAIPRKRFYEVVAKNGVGLPFVTMVMTSFLDRAPLGCSVGRVGEARVKPDLSTKRRIPWSKQDEMVLSDLNVKPGQAWEHCSRDVLRRVSKILKDEFDLVVNAGFETEFFLLRSITRAEKEEWIPFDSSPYSCSSSFDVASMVLNCGPQPQLHP